MIAGKALEMAKHSILFKKDQFSLTKENAIISLALLRHLLYGVNKDEDIIIFSNFYRSKEVPPYELLSYFMSNYQNVLIEMGINDDIPTSDDIFYYERFFEGFKRFVREKIYFHVAFKVTHDRIMDYKALPPDGFCAYHGVKVMKERYEAIKKDNLTTFPLSYDTIREMVWNWLNADERAKFINCIDKDIEMCVDKSKGEDDHFYDNIIQRFTAANIT
jgi:hypothetical protein